MKVSLVIVQLYLSSVNESGEMRTALLSWAAGIPFAGMGQ